MILPFTDPACQDVGAAGGKGASLAAATARGPARAARLRRLLERVRGGASARAPTSCARSRARTTTTARRRSSASSQRPDLGEAFAALGAAPSRCARAPSPRTPRRRASPASRRPTCGVRDAERAADRVVDCWASFFSERALFYRARKGSLDDLRMAVVMQDMVEADVAGVLFTVDPVARRRDQMVVEAVFGLGEPAVSGRAHPRPLHAGARRQGEEAAASPCSRGRWSAARRSRSRRRRAARDALGRRSSRRWRRSAARSRSSNGSPQDIEWAIAGGELYLLQSRPVTTL